MTDIVPNLLRLSSEAADVAELIEPALDLVLSASNCDGAAIARAALPEWSIEAIRGIAKSAVPLDLAAEALEQGAVVAHDGWVATPMTGAPTETGVAMEPEFVLLVRGNCPESRLANIAHRLSDALAVVEEK